MVRSIVFRWTEVLRRLLVSAMAMAAVTAAAQSPESIDIGGVDEWRYLAAAAHPPQGWNGWAFDDAGWPVGSGPFGCGDRLYRTEIPELVVAGRSLYVRRTFELSDSPSVTSLSLVMASDGPFVAYLNGVEVFRSSRSLPYEVDSVRGTVTGFVIQLDGIAHELLPGRNVIAVETSNRGSGSGGFMTAPRLRLELGEGLGVGATKPAGGTGRRPVWRQPKILESNGIRHVILMVCDGWGPQHLEAANQYLGEVPAYQQGGDWAHHWMSTFPAGGAYDGAQAWSNFTYPMAGTTDSAAAATAMVSGSKTNNGRISVDPAASARFKTIGERARSLGMAVGAVTTVQIAHATPAAFTSHNALRSNGYAIGDEAFFGDPNSTGTVADDPKYAGGFGPTMLPTDVLIGDRAASYLHVVQRKKLIDESGLPGKHLLVEGESGTDGGVALLSAAGDPDTRMLVGLFDRANLRVSAADGGYRLETPTLAEVADSALKVLQRDDDGFILMVEGGAVDWAAHANDMDRMIGELRDFNRAVETVASWVEDPANGSSWSNTLVVITGDHETGYLTPAPGVFPDKLIEPGSVNAATLALEKVDVVSERRASWLDTAPENDTIDEGEMVFWAWSSGGHSNTLIPVFARGVGSELFEILAVGSDPVRGAYIDNVDVFEVMNAVLSAADAIFVDGFESGGTSVWSATQP